MTTVKIYGTFTYDEDLMHGDDEEGFDWFIKCLRDPTNTIHNQEVGDVIGTIHIDEVK